MSKYEDPTQLDYRYGGDTVDDFAQKYMKTVAYIFSALNELRSPTGGTLTQNPEAYQLKVDDNKLYIRNQANTDWILLGDVQENFGFRTSASDAFMHESDVADSGKAGKLIRADASGKLNADILGNAAKIADKAIQMGLDLADEDRLVYDKDTDTITNRPLQFKVDGNKIYARKDATTGWVLLGDLKQNLGFRSSTDDAFLTESDVADNGTAGKLIRADVNGKLNADILGNARKMAGKTFAPEDLQDGQIPVYRTSDGTWHAENKGTVGTGKNLMIMDGDKMLGEYNGDEMKAIDIQKSSLTKSLAESTGYGIVSGCEPSINGLTVTVSAGLIHTADGRRVEVPEQSITLDAADATKPRTDVVYLDKYGKIAKLTGELGTPAVAGSNTYTISTNFAAGDTVTFGGVVFTCTASTQDATNFALGADTATSATNLAAALNANSSINAIYTASTSGSVVTITEKSAGGGNTPGAMMTSGTGVVTAGSSVSSTTAFSTAPELMEAVIKVGEISIKAGTVVGSLTASYSHYKNTTITYRNVSTMCHDRTLMPGMVAHTLGYHNTGDGGGANYMIRVMKSEDMNDESGRIHSLINGTIAEMLFDSIADVKKFGAYGDGLHDDTSAVKRALCSLPLGGTLFFPSGTYLITSTINIEAKGSIRVKGNAKGFGSSKGSRIVYQGNDVCFWFNRNKNLDRMFVGNEIDHLYITGSKDTHCIRISDIWGSHIHDLIVDNFINGAVVHLYNNLGWTEGSIIERIMSRNNYSVVYASKSKQSTSTDSMFRTKIRDVASSPSPTGTLVDIDGINMYSSFLDGCVWFEVGGGHRCLFVHNSGHFSGQIYLYPDGFDSTPNGADNNYIYVAGSSSSVNAEGIINAGAGDKNTKFRKLLNTESLWPPTNYYEPRVRVKGATLTVRGKFTKSEAEQIYNSGPLPIFSRFKISINFNYDNIKQGGAIFIAHVHGTVANLSLTKISSLNFSNDLTVTPSKNSFYIQYDGSIPADGCWVIEIEML